MKTNQCKTCGKRYNLQEWKEGDELIYCFSCIQTSKLEEMLNQTMVHTRKVIYQDITDFIIGYIAEMGCAQDLESALLARFDPNQP